MRLIKMFSLAALAAVAAMAFVGVTSASAGDTLLCTKNTASLTPTLTDCAPPLDLGFLTVNAAGTADAKGTLLNSTLNVTCEGLLVAHNLNLDLVNKGPVVLHATLSYKNCTFGCTVSVVKQGLLLVLKTGPELADITGHDFEVRVNCFGFFDCYYDSGGGLVGHGHKFGAAGLGHTTYSEDVVNLVKGSSCPAVGKLDALFQSKSALYIRA